MPFQYAPFPAGGGPEHGAAPVSYTHLDVYKRQHKYRKLLFAEPYLMVYHVAERKVFVDFIVDCRQDYQWLIR